jgi:hypothetical protein
MDKINLQNKTYTKNGTIEPYWFENEIIGLKRTLFHRINIPLDSFNSGLEYEKQPVETAIIIEWLQLNVENIDNLECTDF